MNSLHLPNPRRKLRRFRRPSRSRFHEHTNHSRPRHYSKYILVAAGDSLKSLAQKAYANSSLWYVLAAANALSGDSDLVAGTSLKVPDTGVAKNDSSTFKPYNPNEIIGSTAPSLPYIPPASSNQCAVVAVVIVAIVVIALTYGQAAPYLSSMLTPIATLATTTGITTVGAIAGGFVAGVAGSIASQVVGKALGVVDHFSLRTAVANGFATAITMGVGAATTAMGTVGDMIRAGQWGRAAAVAVVNSSSSYVGNKLAGVKDNSFSWKSIAASAVSTMVSASISNKLNFNSQKPLFGSGDYAQDVMNDSIGGVVSLHTRRAFGFDDKADYGSILANAFGTATGNGLVRAMQGGSFLGRVQKSPESSEQRQIYDAVGPDTTAEQVGKTAADYVNFGSPLSSTTSVITASVAAASSMQSSVKIAGNQEANAVTNKLDAKVNDQLAEIIKYARNQENLGNMSSEQILDYAYKKYYHQDNPYSGQYAPEIDRVTVTAERPTNKDDSKGPLRAGYELIDGGQSRTFLEPRDRRAIKRDLALSGVGGVFGATESFVKKLPSEFNLGVTWKKTGSVYDQLMVTSGKYPAGLSQPMLELSTSADMPKWSVPWAKATPVLKGANIIVTAATPIYDAWQMGARVKNGENVTSPDIGNWTFSTEVGIASFGVGGLPGLAIGATWLGANSYAQSQHYTPLFGEYAGQEINGWNAMRIRGNEYPEVSIRSNMSQFHETREQAAARFQTQQTLEYIRRMERSKL